MPDERSSWINARILNMSGLHALTTSGDKILSISAMEKFSSQTEKEHDLKGALITPPLVDCHTHLIFGGNRASEWADRLSGTKYEEIARRGGGILSTVQQTRLMTCEELVQAALPRISALIAEGVSCVEIKSGYGLTLEDEIKCLKAARKLGEILPVHISATLLAAHAVPPEFKSKADDYVDLICNEIIPRVAEEELAEAVDVFCESIAFNIEQCERVFVSAIEHRLAVKGHMEQLSNMGGSKLAAKYKAWSADHLEYLDEGGVSALRESGTIAVMLPGAFYSLREKQKPPVAALRKAGVPMAIATDCNPGTSPISSLRLAANMSCVLYEMSPDECLRGITLNAAKALKKEAAFGTIEPGKDATFNIWNVNDPTEIIFDLTKNPLKQRVFKGKVV